MIREINNDLILVIVNLSTGIIPNPCQIIEDSRTSFPIWFKRYFSRTLGSDSELLGDNDQFIGRRKWTVLLFENISTKDQTSVDNDTVLSVSGRADRKQKNFSRKFRGESGLKTESTQKPSRVCHRTAFFRKSGQIRTGDRIEIGRIRTNGNRT